MDARLFNFTLCLYVPLFVSRENKGGRSKDGKDAVASPAACEFEVKFVPAKSYVVTLSE